MWDFGDLPVGPLGGGEQRRAVLLSFGYLVRHLRLWVFESGLEVLELAEAGLC